MRLAELQCLMTDGHMETRPLDEIDALDMLRCSTCKAPAMITGYSEVVELSTIDDMLDAL